MTCSGAGGTTTLQSVVVSVTPSSSGLIASYSFGEGSGTQVVDRSGNLRNGAVVGNPAWVAGKHGLGISLGSTSNINLGNTLPVKGLKAYTLSGWMKRTATGSVIMMGKETPTSGDSLEITEWSDGYVYFGVGTASTFTGGKFFINNSSWHNFTLVFDGTKTGNANRLKGYVDGVAVTLSFLGSIPSVTSSGSTPFGIGSLGGYYSNGIIDDVRMYNRVLSSTEVVTDMNTAVLGGQ